MRKKKFPKDQKFPLLKNFYRTLKKMKQKDLCNRLERFVTGSLSTVFNGQTNVKLDNRLVVFDIKDLDESLRQIMILITANFVYSQVKTDPQKRILVIDEAWTLLAHEESARFLAGLTRRARKHYLGVTLISQQANDFLNQEYGRAIASQSSLRILMRQDTTTIKKVAQEFNLSEYEQRYLLTCDKGEGLIIADQNHVALKVVASEKEHPLLTTESQRDLSIVMNIYAQVATIFSFRRELKIVLLAFLTVIMLPVIAVFILAHTGINVVSDALIGVDSETKNIQILDPTTGEVVNEVDKTIAWPVQGVITLEFAQSSGYQVFHTGIDIANSQGTPITPIYAGRSSLCRRDLLGIWQAHHH